MQIEIVIGPDGRVLVHVQGVPGLACQSLTEQLELALSGGVVEDRIWTHEAYETEQEPGQRAQRQEGAF